MKSYEKTPGRRIFNIFNYTFMIITGLVCLLPFVNLLAISLSDQFAVNSGNVTFLPVGFNLASYEFVMKSDAFLRALWVTIKRVVLGVATNLVLIIPAAYALSKEKDVFRARTFYSWFFVITMLFEASLIPWYLTVKNTGLIDSIWALILPGAVPVYSMIVVMNYMRGLPHELEEAAAIDGAGHFRTLWSVILPVSVPTIATVALFAIVSHWNAWFDGQLFMNRIEHYPLQSYLQTVIVSPETFMRSIASSGASGVQELMKYVSARSTRAAQLFIGTLPILCVYPFLQRYFTTGLTLGSVKG